MKDPKAKIILKHFQEYGTNDDNDNEILMGLVEQIFSNEKTKECAIDLLKSNIYDEDLKVEPEEKTAEEQEEEVNALKSKITRRITQWASRLITKTDDEVE